MSGRLRVVVATTAGPSVVRRITAEDADLRSVVCLAGTATALPVSVDYDAFVRRPTGVVERAVGHPAFRMDVDAAIDEGRSWQLGVYIAHRLKACGRLAEDDQAAVGVIWASGTVDADLKIGPVDRVQDKARRSAALFDGPVPVLAVVPRSNGDSLPDGVERLAVDDLDTVLAYLALDDDPPSPGRSAAQSPMRALAVLLLCLVVAIGGGWFWFDGISKDQPPAEPAVAVEPGDLAGKQSQAPAPTPPAFDPDAVTLSVFEARPVESGCGEGVIVDPSIRSEPGVCEVGFRVINTGAQPARMWLYAAVQGTFREYASRQRYVELAAGWIEPGESGDVSVQPPSWVRRPVVVRGLLILADEDRPQVDTALSSIDLMPAGEIDVLVASLRDLGLEVRDVFHRVVPAR